MKKTVVIIVATIVVILVGAGAIFMFGGSGEGDFVTSDVKKAIVGKDWYNSEGDGRHIYFGENGEYAYWENSGNGVDGHDIYEEYEFVGDSGEIEVKGSGRSEIIKIISYNDTKLKLHIGDKTVEFYLQEG